MSENEKPLFALMQVKIKEIIKLTEQHTLLGHKLLMLLDDFNEVVEIPVLGLHQSHIQKCIWKIADKRRLIDQDILRIEQELFKLFAL